MDDAWVRRAEEAMHMRQVRLRAVFMRGGTSKAVMLRQSDLPADRGLWPPLFRAAMGSPDPSGRQLDGMGGGISSLSKVCVIGPPSRADADLDYTFAQVSVGDAVVDFAANCGNMSSAVGPFAVDEGLVAASGGEAVVRIHNTNTGKIIVARFGLEDGKAAVDGDFVVPGVAGSGAPVRLEFNDPGGTATAGLLPTGNPLDILDVPGVGRIEVSLVDAAAPGVFVPAEARGRSATELPAALAADLALLRRLEAIRRAAGVAMGVAAAPSLPRIALVAPPGPAPTLSGQDLPASAMDFNVRMISMRQPHYAVPLTGALCLAVAARIEGSVVHRMARRPAAAGDDIRIGQPSGVTPVAAAVRRTEQGWFAESAVATRTARRLMEGTILLPASRLAEPPPS